MFDFLLMVFIVTVFLGVLVLEVTIKSRVVKDTIYFVLIVLFFAALVAAYFFFQSKISGTVFFG